MKGLSIIIAALGLISRAHAATNVVVRDYEKADQAPAVWVVNIPNEYASVKLSGDQPHDGKQCALLHYRFTGQGNFQYLGVPNKLRVLAPALRLRYWMRGDGSGCGYGVQVTDADGETHQYSANTGQGGVIDSRGWREVVVNLAENHETWGGDKNGKLDYPITAVTFTVSQPARKERCPAEGDIAFDGISVDTEHTALETLGCSISVVSPAYCSEVKGNMPIEVVAPGLSQVTARCWKQGTGQGRDSLVATVKLDAGGRGRFSFPADHYPSGPVTLRIHGESGKVSANCYLQLYNRGGVAWGAGIPKAAPAGAAGLRCLFQDDFTGPLSISGTDPKATYYDHKPPNGWQDFSQHRFTSRSEPNNPFTQVGTYLRIRASDSAKSSGLISSMKNDATGLKVSIPCYFECRFIGPNAIGTWPGFWLMTDYMTDWKTTGDKTPCDEIDIIEAYGGEGPGSPNAYDTYMVTPHAWGQGDEGRALEKKAFADCRNPAKMGKFGIKSTWFDTFHTYGCRLTETDTIYYCDNVEVARHATLPLGKTKPFFFMVNLATGGGWPVDLSAVGGTADMYVDYIRVYAK